MDPKFQSSFIPKTSVIGESRPKEKLGIIGFLSVLIFVGSLVFLGGVYIYKKMTLDAVSGLQNSIASEQSNIDNVAINKLVDFDKKMKSIKSLIGSHVAVSQYFNLLEGDTVSDVQFLSAKYNSSGQDITVEMNGRASSYASIADQDSVLQKDSRIIDPNFDDFILDSSGGVDFTLKFKVTQDAVNFKNLFGTSATSSMTAIPTQTLATTTATTTP